MDIRYELTRNLNLDLTANTDFAQVEVDDQQVNLTRFSLFSPEKRRSFQERSAISGVSLGGNERLFHSRNMGVVSRDHVRTPERTPWPNTRRPSRRILRRPPQL